MLAAGISPRGGSHPRGPAHPPTAEQAAAVDAFLTGARLKVSALAGAGKTSTLVQMAQARAGSGLYLAFNRSIADEARASFPASVDCRTTHSVALRAVRASGGYGKDKLFGAIKAKQFAGQLEKTVIVGDVMTLSDVQQAHLLLGTVKRFCQSADDVIGGEHVPEVGRLLALPSAMRGVVEDWIVRRAAHLWGRMRDPDHAIPLGHDGYLKLWSLGSPVLEHDYILLDEAQDTNPCVLRVLERQSGQVVYVGDRHQQIYAWRGAVNAMSEARAEHEAFLTQSFRFGPAIAEAASAVLCTLGETRALVGNPRITSTIAGSGPADAVLARTNATVISEVLGALEAQRRPHIVGGSDEMVRLVSSVFDLQDGRPASHPDFFGFANWDQVEAFADTEEGEDLRPFVSLVRKHGPRQLWRALKETVADEKGADVVISTAHKAKGRQWPSVRIADDFAGVQTETGAIPAEEARLFYVAITRAQERLVVAPALLAGFGRGRMELKTDDGRISQTSPAAGSSPAPLVLSRLSNGLEPEAVLVADEPGRGAGPSASLSPRSAAPQGGAIPPQAPSGQQRRGLLARLFGR